MAEDEHVIEAIGRTRIVVRNGKVVEVGTPLITDCPLAARFAYPVRKITAEEAAANISERIRSFGLCRADREILCTSDFVLFGASELISCALRHGRVDAAVIACEGAGTVIACAADLVQGIGGRMSGLSATTPIPELIARIEAAGGIVPFPANAAIDQHGGAIRAREAGYERIAVTVASAGDAERIRRDLHDAVIIGVHTTGISGEGAQKMAETCDILSACASRAVREAVAGKVRVQGGISVPVYALTPAGKEIILEKIRRTSQPVLIRGGTLPVAGDRVPSPLI
ncbi:MAG: DUF2099 family protein [Methanomicrobiales archaeon]|nr:DUF2099 family protein [Methanomicrobiales archaeon]